MTAEDDGAQDTLAIVALALGIAALVMSAIPFYGMSFALPLGVVAVVLGVISRRRRPSGRGMATAGAVTGGLALIVSIAWLIAMFAPWWGFRSDVSVRTSSESAAVTALAEPGEAEPPEPVTEPLELETEPDPGPPHDALQGATGEVDLALDDEAIHLELRDCTVGERSGSVHLRGEGPDGRMVIRTGDVSGTDLDVLLVVDLRDEDPLVLTATRTGSGHREGRSMFDRRRVEVVGGMRDALADGTVEVHVVAVCG